MQSRGLRPLVPPAGRERGAAAELERAFLGDRGEPAILLQREVDAGDHLVLLAMTAGVFF